MPRAISWMPPSRNWAPTTPKRRSVWSASSSSANRATDPGPKRGGPPEGEERREKREREKRGRERRKKGEGRKGKKKGEKGKREGRKAESHRKEGRREDDAGEYGTTRTAEKDRKGRNGPPCRPQKEDHMPVGRNTAGKNRKSQPVSKPLQPKGRSCMEPAGKTRGRRDPTTLRMRD